MKGLMKLYLAGVLVIGAPAASADQDFGKFYAFGDSLTDCCVFGRYTQDNTPNWADLLPPKIGASYSATPQTNLAIGGAQSGLRNAVPALETAFGANTGLQAQLTRFEAQGANIRPDDIAGVWIGTNDIWPSAQTTGTLGNGAAINQPLGVRPSIPVLTNYVIDNIRNGIDRLKNAGFQNVVLLSPYDMSQSAITPDAASAELAGQYSASVRDAMSKLYTPGVDTYFFDTFALLAEVQSDPGKFGFLHTTGADNCQAADCSSLSLQQQNTYVFADVIHLTNGFNELMAERIAEVVNSGQVIPVPEPRTWALMAAGLAWLAVRRRASASKRH